MNNDRYTNPQCQYVELTLVVQIAKYNYLPQQLAKFILQVSFNAVFQYKSTKSLFHNPYSIAVTSEVTPSRLVVVDPLYWIALYDTPMSMKAPCPCIDHGISSRSVEIDSRVTHRTS